MSEVAARIDSAGSVADRLDAALARHDALAVAVSGGVDSITLATFAHRRGLPISVIHAVSPAVPAEATARVERLAREEGWALTVTGAGEFDDPRYRENPADRCYFCKTNLYARIRGLTDRPIASGANLDDLGDYRPGLIAAAEQRVVHPLVEARVTKAQVRALARALDLGDIAELPAQPCLSSRVETGIAIDADDLAFVGRVEARLTALIPGGTVRCRITRSGVTVELGEEAMDHAAAVETVVSDLCAAAHRVYAGTRAYRRGAMFIRP